MDKEIPKIELKEIEEEEIKIVSIKASSQHEAAIYEAGKSILLESVAIGRDFCKFMITVSTGAIPLYLGLIKFIYPNNSQIEFSNIELFWMLLPCILFLASATIFIFGLLPKLENFSLDNYDEIESARTKMIKRRMTFTKIGIFVFAGAIIISSKIAIDLLIK